MINRRLLCLFATAAGTLLTGLPTIADDTELFIGDAGQVAGQVQPNILLILDTSSSMEAEVATQDTYDPAQIYDGSCNTGRVYWRVDVGEAPPCSTDQWVDRDAFVCSAALTSFALGTGAYTDFMAQFDSDDAEAWVALDENFKDRLVECEDDRGVHGEDDGSGSVYAQNGNDNEPWSDREVDEVPWGQNPIHRRFTAYDGNYLNWISGPVDISTRLQVMKDVATNLLNGLNGVNFGLMQFNRNDGGSVIHAVSDVGTARPSLTATIDNVEIAARTPLSETLYEAGLYFLGRPVDFGNLDTPPQSVAASREPANQNLYNSPAEFSCQKNSIILLTDGAPNHDTDADDKIIALPDYGSIVGSGCDGEGQGACLDDLAAYLLNTDLNPDLPGQQNVVTHTLGFSIDHPLLSTTAARGGGTYSTAEDTATLQTALTNIVTSIISAQSSFSSPTVSIDNFNRTQTVNELYLTLFAASGTTHWPGNLKKYRLRPSDGAILDANGIIAINPETNAFQSNAQSLWSATSDGADVTAGGAANALPDPANRKLYTYLGLPLLTDPANQIRTSNLLLDEAALGIGNPDDPNRASLIDFIRGLDVTDADLDGVTQEPRNVMGDPLHSGPAIVVYGGTVASPDASDALVFVATNDGYLHAIDADTGVERWAFVPPEFLSDQALLFSDEATSIKHYGVDGNLQVQILANNNGVIEPGAGEKVYLFFGMRRGGSVYYALDVTLPDAPRLLWRGDGATLAGLGQTWSTPIPTRMNIQGAPQNPDRLVLAFGGGYDPSQDSEAGSVDSSGNSIFVVDSVSGALLWHISDDGADKNFADMQYSFPSDLKVIDLNGDQFADRMYAADMGGQVWRFDILNGQPASTLVNGGVIAQLGGAPEADPAVADNRRFYYPPDVALVNDDNNSFLHLGIGSGHRARPNGTANQDRFYALRDYNAFGKRTQAEYDAITPVKDDDLADVTSDANAVVPIGSPGWKLELSDGGWRGEKVLAEARTFNNQIFFTSYTPSPLQAAIDCGPALGSNRLYIIDIFNGAPVNNLDGLGDDEQLTLTDRYQEFEGSIASEPVLLFPSPEDPEDPNCVGDQCTPPPLACVDLFCFPAGFTNEPVRTFWSQDTAR